MKSAIILVIILVCATGVSLTAAADMPPVESFVQDANETRRVDSIRSVLRPLKKIDCSGYWQEAFVRSVNLAMGDASAREKIGLIFNLDVAAACEESLATEVALENWNLVAMRKGDLEALIEVSKFPSSWDPLMLLLSREPEAITNDTDGIWAAIVEKNGNKLMVAETSSVPGYALGVYEISAAHSILKVSENQLLGNSYFSLSYLNDLIVAAKALRAINGNLPEPIENRVRFIAATALSRVPQTILTAWKLFRDVDFEAALPDAEIRERVRNQSETSLIRMLISVGHPEIPLLHQQTLEDRDRDNEEGIAQLRWQLVLGMLSLRDCGRLRIYLEKVGGSLIANDSYYEHFFHMVSRAPEIIRNAPQDCFNHPLASGMQDRHQPAKRGLMILHHRRVWNDLAKARLFDYAVWLAMDELELVVRENVCENIPGSGPRRDMLLSDLLKGLVELSKTISFHWRPEVGWVASDSFDQYLHNLNRDGQLVEPGEIILGTRESRPYGAVSPEEDILLVQLAQGFPAALGPASRHWRHASMQPPMRPNGRSPSELRSWVDDNEAGGRYSPLLKMVFAEWFSMSSLAHYDHGPTSARFVYRPAPSLMSIPFDRVQGAIGQVEDEKARRLLTIFIRARGLLERYFPPVRINLAAIMCDSDARANSTLHDGAVAWTVASNAEAIRLFDARIDSAALANGDAVEAGMKFGALVATRYMDWRSGYDAETLCRSYLSSIRGVDDQAGAGQAEIDGVSTLTAAFPVFQELVEMSASDSEAFCIGMASFENGFVEDNYLEQQYVRISLRNPGEIPVAWARVSVDGKKTWRDLPMARPLEKSDVQRFRVRWPKMLDCTIWVAFGEQDLSKAETLQSLHCGQPYVINVSPRRFFIYLVSQRDDEIVALKILRPGRASKHKKLNVFGPHPSFISFDSGGVLECPILVFGFLKSGAKVEGAGDGCNGVVRFH